MRVLMGLLCGLAGALLPAGRLGGGRRLVVVYEGSGRLCDRIEFSALARGLSPSKTIEVHALTQRMIGAGEVVISLSVGEPDFAPFSEILEATSAAASAGETRYTDVVGTLALRSSICEHLSHRKGTLYDSSEIVVTNGAKQAVYQAMMALCGPGDEVIVPAPYWVSYPEIVKLTGATPVVVETRLEEGYKLNPELLRSALNERTKAVVLCNPCNPTGTCLDESELRAIHNVLRGSNVWVLADEIYERLHYDPDRPHVSFAALDADAFGRCVIINGFSKAYAMTGFRLGYLAAPKPLAAMAAKLQGQLTSCASSISQSAGIAALRLPDDALDPYIVEFKRRRDLVLDRLRHMAPRITCPPDPDGAFYVLPGIAACFGLSLRSDPANLVMNSTQFCSALLHYRKLALVPGDAFGAPETVRISYATSRQTLELAMDALAAFVTEDLIDAGVSIHSPAQQ